MLVGNDLVDLKTRESRGKSGDERFVRRVFTRLEAETIRGSCDPNGMLWVHWAAKEAAFKVVRKLRAEARFSHREYEVRPGDAVARLFLEASSDASPAKPRFDLRPSAPRARGRVAVTGTGRPDTLSFPVEWELVDGRIHCLAVSSPDAFGRVRTAVAAIGPEDHEQVPGRFSTREGRSARSPESRAARRLARRLAREAGLGPVEIVRAPEERGPGPPRLHAPGEASPLRGWDLSLSHDGRFAGAALVGTEERS